MKPTATSIAKKYHLRMLVLFGSRATGRIHKESDADFAAIFSLPLTLQRELQLRHELSQLFGSEVDLVDLQKAPPLLLHEITTHGRKLFGSNVEFSQLKRKAFHRYEDYKPYIRLQNFFNRRTIRNAR